MALIETITDDYHFATWCKRAQERGSSYGHFSLEAAKALQAYLVQASEDEDIEFDPIGWCVEFTEYSNKELIELVNDNKDADVREFNTLAAVLAWLNERTTVIETDNGAVVGEF